MIKVLMHYTSTPEWEALAAINVPILQEYSERHGYELIVERVEPYEKYDGLHKLKMFDYLEDGDVGLFLDGDCLITNMTIPVQSFLTNHDIFVCRGMNMGVFIVRKTISSKMVVLWMKVYITGGKYNCEQDSFEGYIKEKTGELGLLEDPTISVVSHPAFNSYLPELYGHIEHPEKITEQQGRWVPGSFVCHLPSLGMETRLSKMKELQKQIVR